MLTTSPGCEAVTEAWFDPGHWGYRALPVSIGGRGSAWFLSTGLGDLVLRHYLRGGVMAKLSRSRYFYTGARKTRSTQEFRLLQRLYSLGLPVPQPIAAWSKRSHGLFYEAAILIVRVAAAVPFPEAPNIHQEALWIEVGRTIRRFHNAGLDHADLNCDNILIADNIVYLIDFDKSRLVQSATLSNWQGRNLARLNRSVKKRFPEITEQQQKFLWSRLLTGYDAAAIID